MGKKFTYTEKGETIEFEEGEEYYICDWFHYNNGRNMFPVVVKAICTDEDPEEEGVDFYLRTIEHLIPSNLPLGQYEHPSTISVSDWEYYFFKTPEAAYRRLLEEFREDPVVFFKKIFDD